MVRFVFLYIVFVTFWGCSKEVQQEKLVDKDYELVKLVVFDLVDPKVKSFVNQVTVLKSEISRYCADSSLSSEKIKDVWKKAMLDFHYLEALPFGPLGDDNGLLQTSLYSLPQVNADKVIEREIQRAFLKKELYKMKDPKPALLGLDSLEYVFFGRFNSDVEKKECDYAMYVANELLLKTEEYGKRWNQENVEVLSHPSVLADLQNYINPITNAIISFVDQKLKDRKFAAPLGFKDGILNQCSGDECNFCLIGENCHLYFTEHPYALIGKEALLENVKAILDVFGGSSKKANRTRYGYFQYISNQGSIEKNQSEADLLASLERSVGQMLGQSDYPLQFKDFYTKDEKTNQWVENKESLVYQTYLEIKIFSDWLKTDFIADLSLSLPGNVQGDAD